jgi:hypothetical protein
MNSHLNLKLEFKGPFHIDGIYSVNELTPQNKTGIYIWGFMYDKKDGCQGEPIDFSKIPYDSSSEYSSSHMFIPYYVGLDSSINTFTRLKEHHNLFSDTAKYLRFEHSYMSQFYKGGNNFPIAFKGQRSRPTEIKAWLQANVNKDKIQYFNEPSVMEAIYGSKTVKSKYGNVNREFDFMQGNPCYSVRIKKNGKNKYLGIGDTLAELIAERNNMFFAYADFQITSEIFSCFTDIYKNYGVKKMNNTFILEILETITFWSLKGLTISTILNMQPCLSKSKGLSVSNSLPDLISLKKLVSITWDRNLDSIFKLNWMGNHWNLYDKNAWYNSDRSQIFPGY